MSRRSMIVAPVLALALAAACNQKPETAGAKAGSGTGTAAGSAVAIDAGAGPAVKVVIDDAGVAEIMLPPPKPVGTPQGDGTLQLVGIDVLTDPKEFQARAAGAGAKPMEPLVNAAKAAIAAVDGAEKGALGDTVVVWLAIRPGRKLHAWVAAPGKPGNDHARADLAGRMTLAPAPTVTGEVAFAIVFDRSGHRPAGRDIALPPELEGLRKAGEAGTPEQLIDRAWKP
ncbi:MAG TPA: hypothetical protein VHE35_16330 [Kofleriaceae bacterium]|nr:hypothetical protein [Kofleriaceae bacterium]